MKHRQQAERIRNDDSSSPTSAAFAAKNQGVDQPSIFDEAPVEAFQKDILGRAAKVYVKRRKSEGRIQNDEDQPNVSETTNQDDAYPKRRKFTPRIQNDDPSVVREVRIRSDGGRSALLPERYPNEDLFICDVLDAIPKDDMASMEHPMFTLATKPDMRKILYEHKGSKVEILPSQFGLATIHDKDILIYCVSQLIAKLNREEPVSRNVYLKAYDLLVWSNRQISGDGYTRLIAALDRLAGTRIKTNIMAGDEEIKESFGLINAYKVVRQKETGVMSEIKIELSEWLFKMVQGKSVLTLHRDYFRLRKPLERRIYEIVRKHCGQQPRWKVSVDILYKKSGTAGNIRLFRQTLRELEATNHLPDYVVELVDDGVVFSRRDQMPALGTSAPRIPLLDPEALHDARLVAPGYDVHVLYQEWGEWWIESGCPALNDATAAFIGFCKRRHQLKPAR
jgi:hypothetical protein